MIGQTLLHYRITAALGAGGMGEVYLATDTNLGRDVAIKVLSSEVTQNEERLSRFRREAHLLAALNHPNIAAIHGFEEAGGTPFLVLELVEGEELKQRAERGPIPVGEALEIARQIAEALEEAHAKGIVHRDLKPANVKLTPDGKVKVLDFGLAKAWAGDPTGSSTDMSQSPTLAHTGTHAGVILGTAAYMAPEQASGKAVDKRADIWSFGVVLFEMLTGRRLFRGENVSEILAAVIKEDPPWDALPADCPRALTRLLRRCLQRRTRERLQDIGDARLELEDLQAGGAEEAGAHEADGGAVAATDRRERTRERWAWAAAFLLAAGFAAVVATLHFIEAPEARQVGHFVLDTPEGLSLGASRGFLARPAVSPDGRHVAFVGFSSGDTPQLWIRSLDSPEARPLAGTEGALRPFWSPDGVSIAFAAEGELKKLNLSGGVAQTICGLTGPDFHGGTWNDGGTIVFSSGWPDPNLFSVSAAGGEARSLTTLDEKRGEQGHRWPQFLPDGRHVLFLVASTQGESQGLYVAPLEAPDEKRRLLPGDNIVHYASGHLLFVRQDTLFARPFDAGRLEVSGEAVPVAEDVAPWTRGSGGLFGVSQSGVLAYLEMGTGALELVWLDRQGRRLGTLGEPARYNQIALSPDGSRVVAEIRDNRGVDLWVIDVSREVASRVTNDPRGASDAVWSPDSQELVYAIFLDDGPDLFRKSLRGGATAAPLLESPGEQWPEDWSPDGKTLLYISENTFWAVPLAGDGPPELVLKTGFRVDEVHLSPDGRWLAYTSDESGGWEIYVEPFRRSGERVRVSVDGGGQPRWRGDGKELFYTSRHDQLMAVAVREEADGLEVGLPTVLFEMDIVQRPQVDDYAVSADGQRFLVKRPAEGSIGESLHVVLNWPSLLE